MKRLGAVRGRCFLLLLVAFTSSTNAQGISSPPTQAPRLADSPLGGYRIVCLYNNKQFYRLGHRAGMINPHLCTHINYEFAHLDKVTHEMKPGLEDVDIHDNMYKEAVGLKEANPRLTVMLSLGGWEDSTRKYSDLMKVASKVDNFIDKAVAFLKTHKFDGLDVAWEYPNCWQGSLHISPVDKKNFPEFLEKLGRKLRKEGMLLSVSVSSIKREIEACYDVPAVAKAVDFINVMTYDMHGPWEPVTGHHTQLDKVPGDKDPYCNTKAAIELWSDLGAERGKLNVGIATYAKTFSLKHSASHGLGAPAKGPGRPGAISKEHGLLCYSELCQYLNAGNWTESENRHAGFYAFSGEQWACYDPPMMVVKKAKWMVESGCGGILIKDLSCDDFRGECFNEPYLLIKMANMEIKHRVKEMKRAEARAATASTGTEAST